MNPFYQAVYPDEAFDPKSYTALGMSEEDAVAFAASMKQDIVWKNDVYQVAQRNLKDGVRHLSIKRIDREPIHDWRDLQQIKNKLCGDESEAVELYPAESRLVDSTNQYHLWVFPEGERIPLGFSERLVKDKEEADAFSVVVGMNAKQRAFNPE